MAVRQDLVADLRVWASVQPEAADAIEELQAENERLKNLLLEAAEDIRELEDQLKVCTQGLNDEERENEELRRERDATQWYPMQDDSDQQDAEQLKADLDKAWVLLTWASSLIRSLSGRPISQFPKEVAEWEEDWRLLRDHRSKRCPNNTRKIP